MSIQQLLAQLSDLGFTQDDLAGGMSGLTGGDISEQIEREVQIKIDKLDPKGAKS